MAGGLFGRTFVLNEKCIFFSLIIMAIFLYKHNINSNLMLYGVLFIIFVISYVAMAWYDYYFNCDILPLKRGKMSLTGLFKPESHVKNKQEKEDNKNTDNMAYQTIIYGSHILLIVPVLAYLAYYRTKSNKIIYPLLGVLSVFTLIYHGSKMMFLFK